MQMTDSYKVDKQGKIESTCEEPGLLKGKVHFVFGGYKYEEAGLIFDDALSNYLWDLEVINAIIFWYRRESSQGPLKTKQRKCEITIH
mmetsp:Transcript_51841/g.76834  ORF Transcript_51841/g.76834 Transcript_51841/m.76834 type:complete len:88 (-) Transcript_51841:169-432(-)